MTKPHTGRNILLRLLPLFCLTFLTAVILLISGGKETPDEQADVFDEIEPGYPMLTGLSTDGGYSLSFSRTKRNYRITLPDGDPYIPIIAATAEEDCRVSIDQAVIFDGTGQARVSVEKDGLVSVYSVDMQINPSAGYELQVGDVRTWTPEKGGASFLSSDPEIVSIDRKTGELTAKAIGDGPIVITSFDENGFETDSMTISRVTKAQYDCFLLVGQSGAAGEGGNNETSDRPEEGTVFLYANGEYHSLSSGYPGLASPLGKTWHDLTGRKVLFLISASTAGSVADWTPGGEMYESLCEELTAASENVCILSVTCFWMQGEKDMSSSMDEETYSRFFLLFHESLKNRFGLGLTCILPVRSSRSLSSEGSVESGLLTDMLPVRAAQYALHRTREDIYIVTHLTEQSTPQNGMIREDGTGFTQEGYNAIGKDAAESFFDIFSGKNKNETATGLILLKEDGRERFESEETLSLAPGEKTRITPLAEPLTCPLPIEISVSDSNLCTIDEYGLLTILPDVKEVTFILSYSCGEITSTIPVAVKVPPVRSETFTRVEYGWRFDGNLEEKNFSNALSLSDLSPKEGGYRFYDNNILVKEDRTVDFEFETPIRLSSAFDWSVLWRGCLYADSCLIGQNYDTAGYIYLAPWSEALDHAVRFVTSDGIGVLLPYGDTYESNAEAASWMISFSAATKSLSLFRNEEKISEVNTPEFDFTVTNLFGRYGSETVNINFAGEVDWLKIITCVGK